MSRVSGLPAVESELKLRELRSRYVYVTVLIGKFCALVVALSFLAAAVYLIVSGFEVPGTILGTVDLVALAVAFMTTGGVGNDGGSNK